MGASRRGMMAYRNLFYGWTEGRSYYMPGQKGVNGLSQPKECEGWMSSPLFEVPKGCVTIIMMIKGKPTSVGNIPCVGFTDEAKNAMSTLTSDTWNENQPITFTIPSDIRYIGFSIYISGMDDCYAYDATNGAYVWAGKNVDTSKPPLMR